MYLIKDLFPGVQIYEVSYRVIKKMETQFQL